MSYKATKKEVTASRHPAKTNAPKPTAPTAGQDSFRSGHVYEQRKKIFDGRDNPNVAERRTRG